MLRKLRVTWGPGGEVATSGTGTVVHGAGCAVYISAVEQSGTATAEVTFYDGNANNGEQLFQYTLNPNQSTSEGNVLHAWQFERGLYVVTNSGTVGGTVIAWVDHVCTRWLLAEHVFYELGAAEALTELG